MPSLRFALAASLVPLSALAAFHSNTTACTHHYTVKAGDTCDRIGQITLTSTYQILALNLLEAGSNCYTLEIGRQLCLGRFGNDCQFVHRCANSDSCQSIASQYGIAQTLLQDNNPILDCNEIYDGLMLCVTPGSVRPPADNSINSTAIRIQRLEAQARQQQQQLIEEQTAEANAESKHDAKETRKADKKTAATKKSPHRGSKKNSSSSGGGKNGGKNGGNKHESGVKGGKHSNKATGKTHSQSPEDSHHAHAHQHQHHSTPDGSSQEQHGKRVDESPSSPSVQSHYKQPASDSQPTQDETPLHESIYTEDFILPPTDPSRPASSPSSWEGGDITKEEGDKEEQDSSHHTPSRQRRTTYGINHTHRCHARTIAA